MNKKVILISIAVLIVSLGVYLWYKKATDVGISIDELEALELAEKKAEADRIAELKSDAIAKAFEDGAYRANTIDTGGSFTAVRSI